MGKLDTNKKVKRDSLLDTAFRLFMSQGISKTSISDIVDQAGVAKGTFYLYFKDKYDIHNKLICHKSDQLLKNALSRLMTANISDFEDSIVFIADSILNQLSENPNLLKFISKNLSWGSLRSAVTQPEDDDDALTDIYDRLKIRAQGYNEPEIMFFMITNVISSSCYSAVLYSEPADISVLKPHILGCVRDIMISHRKDKTTLYFLSPLYAEPLNITKKKAALPFFGSAAFFMFCLYQSDDT